nr:hypothetical protein [Tanacetum cinerariifolium]
AFQALPPPNYVPSPEEPEQAPPSPVYIPYVPEPVYPEYIPLEDDVFPAEEQPLPAAASPTAESPGYIPESDLDEDPEEDDDEDPEEDPADYLADHDDEEEEHPTSADSIPPPPALCVTARISFRPQPLILSFTKDDAERFLAMPIPPPSTLTPLSSSLPQIPSPPLPASPHILLIPLPAASPPLQLLSSDCRADRPEVTLPPRKRLSIVHFPGYEAGESYVTDGARPIEGRKEEYRFVDFVEAEIRRQRAEDIRYGIRDTWIDPRDVAKEEALTTLEGINTRVTELAAVQEQDTQDIYGVMEDTQAIFCKLAKYYGFYPQLADGINLLFWLAILYGFFSSDYLSCIAYYVLRKMAPKKAAPKRTTRLNPGATSNPNQAPSTTTTTVTNAQLQAMIDQGVNAALAARDANRTGDDIHTSGTEENGGQVLPRNEMKKIETEFWNLEIQGTDVTRSVAVSKPKTMQKATEMATGLMNKEIRTYAERQAANKRKFEDTSRNNQGQQQPP